MKSTLKIGTSSLEILAGKVNISMVSNRNLHGPTWHLVICARRSPLALLQCIRMFVRLGSSLKMLFSVRTSTHPSCMGTWPPHMSRK